MSLRDQILGASDQRIEEVDVSKWWGCKVFVKALNAKEKDELDELRADNGLKGRLLTVMAIFACCDADGNNLFTMADEGELAKRNSAPMEKIFKTALRLNSHSEEKIEETKKNLSPDPNG